jgi:hypothetical protein
MENIENPIKTQKKKIQKRSKEAWPTPADLEK